MEEICPICEGSGLRVVERAGGLRVAESCECIEGRKRIDECEARQEATLTMSDGRRQWLKAQWGAIEKIPTSMLRPQERLQWMIDENGPYEKWPAYLKAAHAEHDAKTVPRNPEAIAELRKNRPPRADFESARTTRAAFTNGIAGMNGKIRGLDPPMSQAELMAWWQSQEKEG